jgi:pimeloyl-ACP methyl ester carboxylesterase
MFGSNRHEQKMIGGILPMVKKIYKICEKRGVWEQNNTISFHEANIPCRIIGKGPSLVVLHGKFQNTYEYERLCHKLAHQFTVYGINHRGHDGSNVQGWITICKKIG